jgi:hypothetical protein
MEVNMVHLNSKRVWVGLGRKIERVWNSLQIIFDEEMKFYASRIREHVKEMFKVFYK